MPSFSQSLVLSHWTAGLCSRSELIQQEFKLGDDGRAIQFVFRRSLNAKTPDVACLFQERQVARDDRAVLHQVTCHHLDVGPTVLQQDQDDLLADRLRNRFEEGRIQCVGKAFDGVGPGSYSCGANAFGRGSHGAFFFGEMRSMVPTFRGKRIGKSSMHVHQSPSFR